MALQLGLGTGIIVLTILMGGGAYWGLERILAREYRWLHKAEVGPRPAVALCLSVLWVMALMTACIWIWAMAFFMLDIFPTLEESIYFTLVSFTTLGFGGIEVPRAWRLLGGMSAANGLLYFGLMTAILVEVIRSLRPRALLAGGYPPRG